jgi:peptide/nickel transport system permease protein
MSDAGKAAAAGSLRPMGAKGAVVDEREGTAVVSRSFGRQALDRFRRHRLAMASVVVLALLAVAFIVGPWLSPYAFSDQDFTALRQGPSFAHPFGTDPIGRDIMVRTFIGGRYSLRIAFLIAVLSTAIGTVIGATAGYFGGTVGALVDQFINLFLIVPSLIILIVLAARYGSGPNAIAFVIAALSWPVIARVVRGSFIQYKEQEFVLAAKAAGASTARIMFRHILPNSFGPIIVNATLLVGTAIILESTLGFLGLGVRPPVPTLGNLIEEAKGALQSKPSAALLPGTFIVLITLCANFIGDGLRDALDPTSRRA